MAEWNRVSPLIVGWLALVVCGACGGGDAGDGTADGQDGPCNPGTTAPCACTDGDSGEQTCRADGSGFDACECAGGNGGTNGSGGSANNGGTSSGGSTSGGAANGGSASGGSNSGGAGGGGAPPCPNVFGTYAIDSATGTCGDLLEQASQSIDGQATVCALHFVSDSDIGMAVNGGAELQQDGTFSGATLYLGSTQRSPCSGAWNGESETMTVECGGAGDTCTVVMTRTDS